MRETITACENVCRDFSWLPRVIELFGNLGDFLVGVSAVLALYGARQWWSQRRSDAKARYMREAFEALTDFSIYLHFPETKDALGAIDLQIAVNRALNNAQLFASAELDKRLEEFNRISVPDGEASNERTEERLKQIEDLRTLLRDQYRSELGLEPMEHPIRWDYWNFRGTTK